jgi:phosphatidylglycerophosphatase A
VKFLVPLPLPGEQTIPQMRSDLRTTEKLILFVAEGFGSGRIPFAPGTFGTLVGFVWLWLLLQMPNAGLYVTGVIAGILFSVLIGGQAERILELKDPGRIVIDEIIAVPIAYLGFYIFHIFRHTALAPSGSFIKEATIVFVLFRILDIWKPWPVRQSQNLPGGLGLTIDDVLAAVYVSVLVLAWLWLL